MAHVMPDGTEMAGPPMDDDCRPPLTEDQAGVPLYEILGPVNSTKHRKYVQDIMLRFDFYEKQLQEYWQNTIRWWRAYMAQRDDFRAEDEKWRANVFVPLPFSGVEAKVATIADVLLSSDPPVQCVGVGDEDYEPARHIERLLDYTLRKNIWRKTLPSLLRGSIIQGTQPWKLTWASFAHEIMVYADQAAMDDFQKRLAEAFLALGIANKDQVPDYAMDPKGFAAFRELVNAGDKAKIPEPPSSGRKQIVRYRGPWIQQLPLYSVVFDPLIENIQEQSLVVHRMVKPLSWVKKQKAYDQAAVEACAKAGGLNQVQAQERALNDMLGFTSGPDTDPYYQDSAELLECWMPGEELQYCVVMNRVGVINVNPPEMPYDHGQIAIGLLRNVVVPGRAIGIADEQEVESLDEEMNSLRSLRLDRTTMETLPAFGKLQELTVPELRRSLRPGALIPMPRQGSIEQLIKYQSTNAFQDMKLIEENRSDATSTYSNVRGAPSEVNRVSATEAQGRVQQALTRLKLQAVVIEEELQQLVDQCLYLWYQKGDPDLRIRIGGGQDALLSLSKSELLEALEIDFQFRGATRTISREMTVKNLLEFTKSFGAQLTPPEMRAVMKLILETQGIKGISTVVSDEGTQYFTEQFNTQVQIQKQQLAMADQKMQEQAMGVPQQIPADVAAKLGAGPGQGQAPATPLQGPGPGGPPPEQGGAQ